MSKRSRERAVDRKTKRVTARERLEKHETGLRIPYLKLPKDVELYRPKAGRAMIDILEYEVGKGNPIAEEGTYYYERTYWVHKGIGPNNDAYICPAKTSNKSCPICRHRQKLTVDREENEKLIYALKPSERQLFNIIDLKNPEKGVQILDMSNFLFGKDLDEMIQGGDEEDGWFDFASYDNGLTVRVNWVDDSFQGASFVKAGSVFFKPRKKEYDQEEMLEEVVCLDDILVELSFDELKKIFLQTGDEVDDDDEDDVPPKRRGKKPVVDDDDDDDDDEDEPPKKSKSKKDDDDDDEDEPPKRGKKRRKPVDDEDDPEEDDEPPKRKKKKEVDDDDDDDDDEDDPEEDDEPPKRRGKKVADDDEDDEPPKRGKKAKSKKADDDDDDGWNGFDD